MKSEGSPILEATCDRKPSDLVLEPRNDSIEVGTVLFQCDELVLPPLRPRDTRRCTGEK